MPGMGKMKKAVDAAGGFESNREILHQEAIISSMTKKERKNPKLMNASRKRRVAAGAGVTVQDVNKLLKAYQQMATMMKKMGKKGGMKGLAGMMGGAPGGMGGAMPKGGQMPGLGGGMGGQLSGLGGGQLPPDLDPSKLGLPGLGGPKKK